MTNTWWLSSIVIVVILSSLVFGLQSMHKAYGNSQSVELHRAEFQVTGSNCASCLRHFALTLACSPGVLKADVSIYQPYWGIVVYDQRKISFTKIVAVAKNQRLGLVSVYDQPIKRMPALLIPKGIGSR